MTTPLDKIRAGRKALIFYVFCFFISVYFFTAQGHLGYNKDGYIRFLIGRNIVEKGVLYFSDKEEVAEFGGWLFKGRGGRYYSAYEIGQSLCFIPFYIAGEEVSKFFPAQDRFRLIKLVSSFLNPVLTAILCVVFLLFLLELGYSGGVSFFTTLILGLGTMLWPESRDAFNHIQAALFILLSLVFSLKSKRQRPVLNLCLSGIFLGFAFLSRMDSVLVLPGISFLIIFGESRKRFLKYSVFLSGLMPSFLAFFCSNYIRFGDIFSVASTTVSKNFFSYPPLSRISTILFSPGKGIFIYSPALIIAILYLRKFYLKNKILALSLFSTCLIYILFLMAYSFWDCVYSWGPRYLLIVVIFLAVLLTEPFRAFSKLAKWQKYSIITVLTLSIFLQFVASSTFHMKYYAQMSAGYFPFSEIQKSFWSVKYSPLARHFVYFLDAARNTFCSNVYSINANVAGGYENANAPAYNFLDWWWVLIYHKGIKAVLFAPFILLSLCAFSVLKIKKSLEEL